MGSMRCTLLLLFAVLVCVNAADYYTVLDVPRNADEQVIFAVLASILFEGCNTRSGT